MMSQEKAYYHKSATSDECILSIRKETRTRILRNLAIVSRPKGKQFTVSNSQRYFVIPWILALWHWHRATTRRVINYGWPKTCAK